MSFWIWSQIPKLTFCFSFKLLTDFLCWSASRYKPADSKRMRSKTVEYMTGMYYLNRSLCRHRRSRSGLAWQHTSTLWRRKTLQKSRYARSPPPPRRGGGWSSALAPETALARISILLLADGSHKRAQGRFVLMLGIEIKKWKCCGTGSHLGETTKSRLLCFGCLTGMVVNGQDRGQLSKERLWLISPFYPLTFCFFDFEEKSNTLKEGFSFHHDRLTDGEEKEHLLKEDKRDGRHVKWIFYTGVTVLILGGL